MEEEWHEAECRKVYPTWCDDEPCTCGGVTVRESRVVKDRKCWTCGEVLPTTARGIEAHGKVCVPARSPLPEAASGASEEVHKPSHPTE